VVQERTEAIHDWLESHQEEIKAGQIRVYALAECHAKNGDACGYLWGDRQERGEVIVENYRESQSYLDCVSQQMTIQGAKTANSESTIEFIQFLKAQCGGVKMVLIWDEASYHRSQELRDYLEEVNQGEDWQIHCLRLAPYAP